ncbi:hypothetical protein O0L34_g19530 [Tuta absoluta]|nr:hypothetical protein O0L34_g19530 [Tuta absoluta]
MTNAKMVSFNCKSVKRSCQHIRDLCNDYHIISLQEHWLTPEELNYLNTIDNRFASYGLSAMNSSACTIKGRPFGGVAVLWRKDLFTDVTPLDSGCPRVAAVRLQFTGRSLIVMSVYMPTDLAANLPLLTECYGVMSAVCAFNDDVDCIICLDDYNSDVNRQNNLFGSELLLYCKEEDWVCADIQLLGQSSGTFTFLSDGHGTTSWIDHIIVTPSAMRAIKSVRVINDVFWSDHFPVSVECNFDVIIPKVKIHSSSQVNKTLWGNRSKEQQCKYTNLCTNQGSF